MAHAGASPSSPAPDPAPGSGDRPELTPLRELQLVEAARNGDRDAWSELLENYHPRVYGVCRRMLRNPELAADATQDALIRVIEGLPSYQGDAKLSTWIIRVAMNVCLSLLRREKIRDHASLDDTSPGAPVPRRDRLEDPGELSPAGRVEHRERQTAVLDALNAVDPEVRALLVLRDLQGLEYQQIGEVLDLPIGTVKSRLFRARQALRQAIESNDSNEH